SRLDFDKRVDLLHDIARTCQNKKMQFTVYGTEIVGNVDGSIVSLLKELPNVQVMGEFAALEDIAAQQFDAFLYTSASDGFPIVLLEAAAMNLPVVASDVGGVSELVNGETGYLITPPDDVDAYVKALLEIQADKRGAARRCERMM